MVNLLPNMNLDQFILKVFEDNIVNLENGRLIRKGWRKRMKTVTQQDGSSTQVFQDISTPQSENSFLTPLFSVKYHVGDNYDWGSWEIRNILVWLVYFGWNICIFWFEFYIDRYLVSNS